MSLQDKVILVTGAASGIGLAAAQACAAAGARVLLADRNEDAGQAATAALVEGGAKADFFAVDVADTASVEAMFRAIKAQVGRIDGAVNNAGIEGAPVRTVDVSESDFDQVMAVNVKGVWLCMRAEIPMMIAQGGGNIVNMASVAGLVGAHSMPVYAASKHAVVGLTKSAALEYARKGLRINAVCPSVIRTPMVERAMEALPQLKDSMLLSNPSRRLGEPEEVAAAVVWLLADSSSFINGAALPVDGGLVAQ